MPTPADLPVLALAHARARFAEAEAALVPAFLAVSHALVYDRSAVLEPHVPTYPDGWDTSCFTASPFAGIGRAYDLVFNAYPNRPEHHGSGRLCLGYTDHDADDFGGHLGVLRRRVLRPWDQAGNREIVTAALYLDQLVAAVVEMVRGRTAGALL